MRTQKLPGLSKANGTSTFSLFFLHYDLIYGASETERQRVSHRRMVSYCLDYDTSKTAKEFAAVPDLVSYYLVYRTSETERQRVAHRRMVNYYLIYGISETE